jgi:hypothetical protein
MHHATTTAVHMAAPVLDILDVSSKCKWKEVK